MRALFGASGRFARQHERLIGSARALTTIGLAVLLVSCSPAAALLGRVTPSPAPTTLRVGVMPYLSNSVIAIGIEEGYFAAQGLAIETVSVKGSADMLALLATGEIEAGTPAMNPGLINAVAAGSKMRLVLPLTVHVVQDCATAAFVARTADVVSGKFSDPADWKGARVMLSPAGLQGTGGYFLTKALEQGGLTMADVETLKSESAVYGEALRSDQVDIVFALEPWVTRLIADGDLSIVLPIEPLVDGLQSSAIAYSESLMANEDAAQRFAVAYMQAVRQYAQGATPRNVEIVAAFAQLDAELVKRVCWSYAPTDGTIDAQSLATYQEWLLAEGLVDRVLEPDEYIDTRFAEEAVRELDGSR